MTLSKIPPRSLPDFFDRLSDPDFPETLPEFFRTLKSAPFAFPQQYYLTKKRADSLKIDSDTRELWNQLIAGISSRLEIYRFSPDKEQQLLSQLQTSLSLTQRQTPPAFRLRSRFQPVEEPFIGRTSQLEAIRCHFVTRETPLFLYGMGGVGKTELARAYATHYSEHYDTILFVEYSESLQSVLTSDTRFPLEGLSYLPSEKHGEAGWFFRKKLKTVSELVNSRTLIILDGFDTLGDKRLEEFCSLPCHLLFTTRTNPVRFGFEGIHLLPFEDVDDCTDLFYRYYTGAPLTQTEQTDVAELLAELNGHALSIRQAAVFLSRPEISTSLLLDAFYDVSTFEQDVFLQVLNSFRISLLTRKERTILRYLSVLPESVIALEDFLGYCRCASEADIRRLMIRGLIDLENNTIHIYPLIAQAVRETEKKYLNKIY